MDLRRVKVNPGPLYAFVPADEKSRAGAAAAALCRALSEDLGRDVLLAAFDSRENPLSDAIEAPRRLDGSSWGAFTASVGSYDVLDAREMHPSAMGRLMQSASERFDAVCVDLSGAKESHAERILPVCTSVFVVSDSSSTSLDKVRETAAWLRRMGAPDDMGLLLNRIRRGVGVSGAEDHTGLPVCGLLGSRKEVAKLAAWLAPVPTGQSTPVPVEAFAPSMGLAAAV